MPGQKIFSRTPCRTARQIARPRARGHARRHQGYSLARAAARGGGARATAPADERAHDGGRRARRDAPAADAPAADAPAPPTLRIAFLGNSIFYFNDVPRLLEAIGADGAITTDCCLRGGADVEKLLDEGGALAEKFATPNALRPDGSHDAGQPSVEALLAARAWDFVVINDYTQAPARAAAARRERARARRALGPMLRAAPASTGPCCCRRAYREHTKGSDDLGDNEEFTRRLSEGYAATPTRAPAPAARARGRPRAPRSGRCTSSAPSCGGGSSTPTASTRARTAHARPLVAAASSIMRGRWRAPPAAAARCSTSPPRSAGASAAACSCPASRRSRCRRAPSRATSREVAMPRPAGVEAVRGRVAGSR